MLGPLQDPNEGIYGWNQFPALACDLLRDSELCHDVHIHSHTAWHGARREIYLCLVALAEIRNWHINDAKQITY